jgi:antitoxin ParD1/3/4
MKRDAMRPLTISLSPQQIARLQAAVDRGDYASTSEVVRDALRLWDLQEEMRALEIARLKAAYEEGLASGPAVAMTADELYQRPAGMTRQRFPDRP